MPNLSFTDIVIIAVVMAIGITAVTDFLCNLIFGDTRYRPDVDLLEHTKEPK